MKVTSDVGPWAIVPEWVLDAPDSDRAVRLYGMLGRYADRNGASYPSRRTLAERLRCSVDSLDRAVRELVTVGALEIAPRNNERGDQTSNLYMLKTGAPVRHPLGTPAATPLGTGAPQNESHVEREKPSMPSARQRNEIWDALSNVFGEPSTRSSQELRGKVVASLRSAGATPDEIYARAKRWALHFDHATMTDLALEKHWDTLARKPLRRTR